jgi:hypothetical protein
MKAWIVAVVCAVSLVAAGCGSDRRDDSAARQAGREAYKAGQEAKKAAKEAGQKLRKAGREAREGWNEAKREDATRRK